MATDYITESEIRRLGIEALVRELGPVGMARFLRQFDRGSGDWTKERQEVFAGETVESLSIKLRELSRNRATD